MENPVPEHSVPNSQLGKFDIVHYTIGNCDIEEDKKKEAAAAQEMIPARKVYANQAVATEEKMVSAEFFEAPEMDRKEEFYQAKIKDMQKEAQREMEESSKVIGKLQRQIEKLEAELEAVKKAVGTSANPLKELSMNI